MTGSVENIKGAASTAQAGMQMLTSGNIFVNLLMGGSLEHLWGMIRSMQMISLVSLVNVPIPAMTTAFLMVCIEIQGMDVMQGGTLFGMLKFKETKPLNSYFDMFGFGNLNFIQNSGSSLIIVA